MLIEQPVLMTNPTLPVPLTEGPTSSLLEAPRRSTALLVLTGLWFIIFFVALFTPPLLDDADATHSNAARHMALTGDLVTLHVNGIRYLEKAPLSYWLVTLSFRIFGFNTFAAHLPQAIGVLLLAFLGFRWADRAFNTRTAFYTGLAILTSAGVFLFTRIFIPEVLLSLFLCTALYCLLQTLSPNLQKHVISTEAQRSGETPVFFSFIPNTEEAHQSPGAPSSRGPIALRWAFAQSANRTPSHSPNSSPLRPNLYPYAMWTTLALAVLTKGLVALVFFGGAALIYLALTGEYKNWRSLKPITGTLLFLAIAAPWHILAALRNTGGMNGHGFFWFYFINEHFLRFLGKRYPMDYNKLPSYLFWTLHLVWLFPWSLFCGALLQQGWNAYKRYIEVNPIPTDQTFLWQPFAVAAAGILLRNSAHIPYFFTVFVALAVFLVYALYRRQKNSLHHEPLLRTATFRQRTTLLLTLYTTIVLVFFSISTNQEYYTFPAYLPILILIAAALTRAEDTYAEDRTSRRWINFAHATFTILGLAIAATLAYGLWTSRHLPFVPDIGDLLAHRNVGDYTLSMSHLFDLTGPSFAALRLPATLAALAFATCPAIAWLLRTKRRHLAATTTIALTSTIFLIAAHIAFARFGTMLSSENFAAKIQQLEDTNAIAPNTDILMYGDQAYGSSIPFYLGRTAYLVEGRSTSMLFGSTFPDAPPIFLTNADLLQRWGKGQRKVLFVPLEKRDDVDHLLGNNKILLQEISGKALYTDRPLNH
jgi:4-amino-4-deoxy-L-arabinose transferase-like glycosyltransferase